MGAQGAQEREEEWRVEAEELGAGEEPPLFLPMPSSMASADGSRGWRAFFCSFLAVFLYSLLRFLQCASTFLGQAWAEGKGELVRCRLRVDSCISHDLPRSHTSNE